MSVHLRKSENEAIEIFKKYRPQKCIIHWFTGSVSQLNQLLSLGCYFSVNTNMSQSIKTNKKILQIPRNKILIESDGPFTKVNGRKFSPEYLQEAYSIIENCFDSTNFNLEIFKNFSRLLNS